MRLLKIIAFSVGGLLALVLVVVVAVLIFVNPNDYKDRIVREVKVTTGRDLALPGAIKLSVFPWVALELGPASLGNPSGFRGGDFLSVEHVALRLKLLPLLHRNLQIGRIEIDQLSVHLLKDAAGRGNWQDIGKQDTAATGHADGESGQSASIFQSLAGIVITKSSLTSETMDIADLNLKVGSLTRQGISQYVLSDLTLTGELKSKTGAPDLPFRFSGSALAMDLAAQTLRAPNFAAQLASAKLSGTLNGEQIIDHPTFAGELALEPVDLRELMAQLGSALPKTRDAQAFARLSVKTNFRYATNSMSLPTLDAQLDDSRLRGSVAVTDLDSKETRFELSLDHIDIDRYRSVPVEAPAAASQGKPAALPSSTLKPLEMQGTFVIGSARFSGLALSDVNLTLHAHGGLIQLSPLKATLYGGQYAGDVTYDVRGTEPLLQLNQHLTGIDMTPLLKDALNSQRLSGHGNANMALTGRGATSDALMKSLNGRFDLNLANGAIEGADVGYEIGLAQALLNRQSIPATANTRRTGFDAFKLSAMVSDGLARTDDLTIATAYLHLTGHGTANLVNKAIDLNLVATVLKAPVNSQGTDVSQLTLAAIPVSVTGTADAPRVRPDIQGVVKSQVEQKAKDLIKNKLNERLKGLFGTH